MASQECEEVDGSEVWGWCETFGWGKEKKSKERKKRRGKLRRWQGWRGERMRNMANICVWEQ